MNQLTTAEVNEAEARRIDLAVFVNQNARQVIATAITLGEPTWTTTELQEQFHVEGFCAPFVVVTRKIDGVRGSLMFTHSPRLYFSFEAA